MLGIKVNLNKIMVMTQEGEQIAIKSLKVLIDNVIMGNDVYLVDMDSLLNICYATLIRCFIWQY